MENYWLHMAEMMIKAGIEDNSCVTIIAIEGEPLVVVEHSSPPRVFKEDEQGILCKV